MEIKALSLLHSTCYCCPTCQEHLRNEYFKSTFGFMILTILAIKWRSNALYPHHERQDDQFSANDAMLTLRKPASVMHYAPMTIEHN